MMKKLIVSLFCLILVSVFSACGSAGETLAETDTAPEQSRTYTHEERIEILNDTMLKFSADMYDPALMDRYFDLLKILREEYFTPGKTADEKFTEFLTVKEQMNASVSAGYPTILITADSINKNTYVSGSVTVLDGGKVFESPIEVTVRGNSTADAPKKPYNIRFPEAVSLFGMEEGRKWSLLANAFDKTLLRNRLALNFAETCGLRYTSQCEFAEVWVNGVYQGNYLVCEPVSDGKNRVGVDTSANEFILEITPCGDWQFVSGAGVKLRYDNPESPTEAQKKYVNQLLKLAEDAMATKDSREYSKYVDAESFLNLYIQMELFKDVDGYWKSLYVYIKDGKLCAGPAWDFDLTCGNVNMTFEQYNYHMYHNKKNHGDKSGDSTHGLRMDLGWFAMLLDDPAFAKAVSERYAELQPAIKALYEGEDNAIDALIAENSVSFEREYRKKKDGSYGAGWSISECYSIYAGESKGDYEDNVEFLRSWIENRNGWLLKNIGKTRGNWKCE